jgi:tRNA-uridine 2-sulfurtransferase
MEPKMNYRGHGIALFSGGLDSTVAILVVRQQEIKVTALTFMTHFGCDITDTSSCAQDPSSLAERFGFTAKIVHLGEKFIDIVKNPRFGYGRNMNPCIDCRILMLKEAAEFMNLVGADFVFTGEVLGQRPMSQHRRHLDLISHVSGLEGKLVRPLSAQLLTPTEPELSGLLDRSRLERIAGRSRRRQMELAAQFGVDDYPDSGSGCLLTDIGYSRRLRDLLSFTENVDFADLNLLRVGRHFRVDGNTKVIVGRNKEENDKIQKYRKPGEWLFEAKSVGSPLTLLKGGLNERNIYLAAALTARYCDAKYSDVVEITYFDGDQSQTISTAPADDTDLEKMRL